MTIALKSTVTLLHKTQPTTDGLLLGATTFDLQLSDPPFDITWPEEVQGQSSEVRGQWTRELLDRATQVCTKFLEKGKHLIQRL